MIAAVWLVARLSRMRSTQRTVCAAAITAIATLYPFGVPALAGEVAWSIGFRYPRAIHWKRIEALAGVIQRNDLSASLAADYQPSLCPAIAVYAPISCDKGHWVEVQPQADPADALSAARKVYVLALKPDDTALEAMARRGWLRVWGGTTDSTVVTLAARAPLDPASAAVGQIIAAEAAWLSSHAINNSSSRGDWLAMLSPSALPTRRAQFFEQRERAGLIELALIVDAYALEPDFPRHAARIRRAARAFGVIASFLGDSLALDFESDAATARLKWRLGLLSSAAQSMDRQPPPDLELERALGETIEVYLFTKGATFAERPPDNLLPWLSALPSAH